MKSVGITKYEALWQITRVSVKGPHISLEKNLKELDRILRRQIRLIGGRDVIIDLKG